MPEELQLVRDATGHHMIADALACLEKHITGCMPDYEAEVLTDLECFYIRGLVQIGFQVGVGTWHDSDSTNRAVQAVYRSPERSVFLARTAMSEDVATYRAHAIL